MFQNRIGRLMGADPKKDSRYPSIPSLTDPAIRVLHIGTDIIVWWEDTKSTHLVNFNTIFGAVTTWGTNPIEEN